MKVKSGFVLHSLGSEHVVVAVDERCKDFRGMIRLNETGHFLWNKLQTDCTQISLERALMRKYGISEEIAWDSVTSFLEQLKGANVIE